MDQLRVFESQGIKSFVKDDEIYIDSRMVSEMIDKRHDHLIRDIRKYVETMDKNTHPKFGGSEKFFVESTYKDSTGRTLSMYLLTEKGCEFVANKMTGEKGTLFTAQYITVFHEMKEQLKPSYMINDPIARAEKWIEEQKEKKQVQLQLEQIKPKAEYYDLILRNKQLLKVTPIAKDYGMSAEAFNKLLNKLKVQYKQGTQWFLYHQYHDKGYTHSETVTYRKSNGKVGVNIITKWTQKGRVFLYELLKDNGILPVIERDDSEAV